MANQDITVIINSSQAESALRKLNNLFGKQGLAIQSVTRASETLNTAQETLAASFSGVLTSGQKFNASLDRTILKSGALGKRYLLVADNIETYASAQDRATAADVRATKQREAAAKLAGNQALTDINQGSARKFAQQDIPKLFGSLPKQSLPNEVAGVERQQRAIEKMIASGQITRGAFHKVFTAISQDSTVTFTGMEADAARAARSIIASFDKINNRISGNSDAIVEARRRSSAAKAFSTQDVKQFYGKIPENAKPEKVASFQNSVQSAAKLIETGKVTRDQFNRIFDTIKTNGTSTFTGIDATAATAIRRMNTSFKSLGQSGASAAKEIILGWTGVIRIFAVHTLHLAISQVIFGFRDVAQSAADFSTKIAEIQTITQDASASTEQWSRGLRSLSDSLGIDAVEVATAAYEALSNQAAKGTDVIKFLSKAAIFAKTTNSSLANSVDLLTSVTNSYTREAISAERASEIFFTVIDLGRVKADELASSMGTVLQPASQLGIRVEEVGAAIATLSQQGINADTTLTLIRNVLIGLIKPTAEMQTLIKSWGVPTGEAAIKTFTWTGVLEKLSKELETGGISRLGELEGDIRKLTGTLGLTKNIDTYRKSLEAIDKSGPSFKNAEKSIRDSFGDRFKAQVTGLKNVFNIDLGNNLLRQFVEISESFGGIGNALKKLSEPIVNIVSNFTNVGTAALTVASSIFRFADSFGGLSIASKLASTSANIFITRLALEKVAIISGYEGLLKKSYTVQVYGAVLEKTARNITNFIAKITLFKEINVVAGYISNLTYGLLSSIPGFNGLISVLGGFGTAISRTASNFATYVSQTKLGQSISLNFGKSLDFLTKRFGAFGTWVSGLKINLQSFISYLSITIGLLNTLANEIAEAKAKASRAQEEELSKKTTDSQLAEKKAIDNFRREFLKSQQDMEKQTLQTSSVINQEVTKISQSYIQARQAAAGGLGVDISDLEIAVNGGKTTADIAKETLDLIKESQGIVKDLQTDLQSSKFTGQLLTIVSEFDQFGKSLGSVKNGFSALDGATLIGPFKGVLAQTDFVLTKIEELKTKAVKLYDSGNIADARVSLSQASELAKTLEGANPADTIADLAGNARNKLEDLQLKSLGGNKKSLIARAKDLEGKAINLFNLGNLEAARDIFSKVDSILDDVTSKDATLNKSLKSLGITSKPKTDLQKGILENRLKVFANGSDKLAGGQTLSQQLAQQRIDSELKLQTNLKKTAEIYSETNDTQNQVLQRSQQVAEANQEAASAARKLADAWSETNKNIESSINKLITAQQGVDLSQHKGILSPDRFFGKLGIDTTFDFGKGAGSENDVIAKEKAFRQAQSEFDSDPKSVDAFNKKTEAAKKLVDTLEQYLKIQLLINKEFQKNKDGSFKRDQNNRLIEVPLDQRDLKGKGNTDINSFDTFIQQFRDDLKKSEELFKGKSAARSILEQSPDLLKQNDIKNEGAKDYLQKLLDQSKDLNTDQSSISNPDFSKLAIDDLPAKFQLSSSAASDFAGLLQSNLNSINLTIDATIAKIQSLNGTFGAGTNFSPVQDRNANFSPTLQAVNSNPRRPANNAVVNNTEVGEINLNIENSTNEQELFERIVAGIRRGLRTGNITLG